MDEPTAEVPQRRPFTPLGVRAAEVDGALRCVYGVERMGKTYNEIDSTLSAFLYAQRMFFVGTAPMATDGHVNVSPKGLDAFRILGPQSVAYIDYNGSGVETIAHLRENGRIVLMFCAFEGPPKIVRLHGRGQVVLPQDQAFTALVASFAPQLPVRAVIRVDLDRISDSCGYGVPLYEFRGDRDHAHKWAERKGDDGIASYQREKNAISIDGLSGLTWSD